MADPSHQEAPLHRPEKASVGSENQSWLWLAHAPRLGHPGDVPETIPTTTVMSTMSLLLTTCYLEPAEASQHDRRSPVDEID